MKNVTSPQPARLALFLVTAALAVGMAWPLAANAQSKPADAGKDLAGQLGELRAKVAKLEAALAKGQQGKPSGMSGMGGAGGMGMMEDDMMMGGMGGKKKGMGMAPGGMGMDAMEMDGSEMTEMMKMMRTMMEMKMMQMKNKNMMGDMTGMQGDTGVMPGKGMGMMDMDMQEMMGMMGMGGMGQKGTGMGKMQMATTLPGFPGVSHIYHVGATGFFIDHSEHITLTKEQQTELNGLKEQALLEKSTSQRKIDEAEQELWMLTASDQPDAKKIDVKVREIEKLRGDQRIAFVRAVGEAANVLTPEQRQTLVGTLPPNPAANTNHKHIP